MSPGLLKEHLSRDVSPYAGVANTEVISEVIVGDKSNPTEFTKEFISLLNGALL